ncbi:carbohydrate sulfotransferase 11-like [Saccoglossus kowalevskii]|uniref:Carbohydrate sulfotransferase n=1 Tax=Saccoglossus kowalevskii TaxID=10224 RepID=A0ABM0MCK1_SACKO|nr:PREDICTED: carbohydrate sulfotransferase 11-like [Saccoglossus kowalevskii]
MVSVWIYKEHSKHFKVRWYDGIEHCSDTVEPNINVETKSPVTPIGPSNTFQIWQEKHRRRKEHLATMCQRHPELNNISIQYANIFVDDTYKILYCPVPKVANSNWRRVLLVLRGTFTNVTEIGKGRVYEFEYPALNNFTKTEKQLRLSTYTKFMFSRHPLSRLLSAYSDKLRDTTKRGFLRSYTVRINEANKTNYTIGGFCFEEFVNYVLQTESNRFDRHWALMGRLCAPCAMNYDFLGQYETLNEDVNGILKTINASEVVDFSSYVPHKTNSSSVDILKENYGHITKQQIEGLYKKYEMDFRLFDYNTVEYLKMSKS